MKLTHGYYHLIAILTVAIWGLTFIATKVLINHGPKGSLYKQILPNKEKTKNRQILTIFLLYTLSPILHKLTVAIWGLTFIATKVLINHGLTPQEIFFYRFLIAYIEPSHSYKRAGKES